MRTWARQHQTHHAARSTHRALDTPCARAHAQGAIDPRGGLDAGNVAEQQTQ
jgi:hypothetical protein